ncbi:MAG: ABC transporter permease [Cyclobacteriaceae bacterium]
MSFVNYTLRSLAARPLGTALSILLLALGTGLVIILLHIDKRVTENLEKNIGGIDMVIGAKGSPLQLILSAVYHVDNPTGNIDYHDAERIAKHPLVGKAIMLAYGDYYQGYRILGTSYEYAEHYQAELAAGSLWEHPMEVTVGALVAQRLELKIGDTFFGQHGGNDGHIHEEETYIVKGIFKAGGTVVDNLILTSLKSVWHIHDDHEHESDEQNDTDNKAHDDHSHTEESKEHANHDHHNHNHHDHGDEITAMLLQFRNPTGLVILPSMISEETKMQAAVPMYETARLTNLLGVGFDTLRWIAWLIIGMASLSILFALLQSLQERKYELALIRSWGAGKFQLFLLVLYEGIALVLAGFISGMLISRLFIWLATLVVPGAEMYGIKPYIFIYEEVWLLGSVVVVGIIASLIPAIQAIRVNISKTLSHV